MKDRYFPHDLGARNDPKLIELQMEMKGTGLAIWWCLVEMLFENDGYLPLNPRSIAFSLRWARPADVDRVINDFGLFDNDGERFWSKSALARIKVTEEATERARNAAKSRWNRGENADAMQAQCDCNAIKEIKEKKEIKENISLSCAHAQDVDKHKILEIFFFELNAPQPAAEVQRFIDHYSARGWKLGDGNPVVDHLAVARLWKPEKPVKRFPQLFLRWYKRLYLEAGKIPGMLSDLLDGELKGSTAMLRYTTKKVAESARDILGTKPSAQGIDITWKFNNQGNA